MAQSPLAISRMQKVPLREVWLHEAHNLTRWLADNIDLISECIGTPLTFVEREKNVGPFFADIVAEDAGGRVVLIENQLEQTNHDHLGKLITYMSNLDAKTAIWITPTPREEHQKAVQWLNEFLPADIHFYLLRIEAYRIDDSPAAPLLTVVAGPSDVGTAIGEEKKQLATRHESRLAFWSQLLERARPRTALHSRSTPSIYAWLSANSGLDGVYYVYQIKERSSRVELAIESGNQSRSKRIFDLLYTRKLEIESAFGAPLVWERQDDKKHSYIRFAVERGRIGSPEEIEVTLDLLITAMIDLERAFAPELDRVRREL